MSIRVAYGDASTICVSVTERRCSPWPPASGHSSLPRLFSIYFKIICSTALNQLYFRLICVPVPGWPSTFIARFGFATTSFTSFSSFTLFFLSLIYSLSYPSYSSNKTSASFSSSCDRPLKIINLSEGLSGVSVLYLLFACPSFASQLSTMLTNPLALLSLPSPQKSLRYRRSCFSP